MHWAVFLGQEACEVGLVDQFLTSGEYASERITAGDQVFQLIPYKGPQFGLKLSPLDLLLWAMDAERRAKIWGIIQGIGMGVLRHAPLFWVGAAVGILNHLALLQSQRPGYSWVA